MGYHYAATTVGGFVQQLALCYLEHGYWFYVQGIIPEAKDLAQVDNKLLTKYHIPASKFQRCRRKRNGGANLQYLRYERTFLLLATHGIHEFFQEEAQTIKDVRRSPIQFEGYSIGYYHDHPRVSLARDTYRDLRAYLLELAVHRSADFIAEETKKLPYEGYGPVRRQLFAILLAVNTKRRQAGLDPVPFSCLPAMRHLYKPFEPQPPCSAGCGHKPVKK